ncbi:MAG: tetratricopeptide repeat protein [Candidatus Omnitrophica bacterium]|nr:tetratricopeptide repeat protein [Candidatus Omnitrophota bacterium]
MLAMATVTVPSTLQPYFEKGIQAYTQGSYEYAVDLLTFVIKQAPDATEARRYLRLAIQKLSGQHPPSWLSQVGALVAGLPFRFWAALCSLQGQHQHAVQLYERLLCLQPRSRGLLMQLASALNRAGLDEAALAAYEEVLGIDPNHMAALRKLARLSMKHGNDEQARRCFERIRTVAPNDLEAQQGLRNLDALGAIKKGFTA